MKLFYTPVERMLLTIHDPNTVVMNKFLWHSAWSVCRKLEAKRGGITRLTGKEARLATHVCGLLKL